MGREHTRRPAESECQRKERQWKGRCDSQRQGHGRVHLQRKGRRKARQGTAVQKSAEGYLHRKPAVERQCNSQRQGHGKAVSRGGNAVSQRKERQWNGSATASGRATGYGHVHLQRKGRRRGARKAWQWIGSATASGRATGYGRVHLQRKGLPRGPAAAG